MNTKTCEELRSFIENGKLYFAIGKVVDETDESTIHHMTDLQKTAYYKWTNDTMRINQKLAETLVCGCDDVEECQQYANSCLKLGERRRCGNDLYIVRRSTEIYIADLTSSDYWYISYDSDIGYRHLDSNCDKKRILQILERSRMYLPHLHIVVEKA